MAEERIDVSELPWPLSAHIWVSTSQYGLPEASVDHALSKDGELTFVLTNAKRVTVNGEFFTHNRAILGTLSDVDVLGDGWCKQFQDAMQSAYVILATTVEPPEDYESPE